MEIKPDLVQPQWEPKFRALIESLPEPISATSYEEMIEFIERLLQHEL